MPNVMETTEDKIVVGKVLWVREWQFGKVGTGLTWGVCDITGDPAVVEQWKNDGCESDRIREFMEVPNKP